MRRDTDFLLIGSGIGGLTFALRVAEYGTVSIITKKSDQESSTNYAQGGIAAVVSPDDSLQSHIDDTLKSGAGLCREKVVKEVIYQGPECIRQLVDWGVRFTQAGERSSPVLALGREGGHSHERIVHASDRTGAEVERALLERIKSHPNINIYPHHLALELATPTITSAKKSERLQRCHGAYILDVESGEVHLVAAKITLLATGGCGHTYLHTTNPQIATGDGIAMAYRAGAVVANLEFMQFHPTSLYHPEAKSFLISEAVRGFGAVLMNRSGERFMQKYHPDGELAPRDVVARAIDREMKTSGEPYVLLDLTDIDSDKTRLRFPYIYKRCLEYHIDITSEPIPVVPAAHYMCGGVRTDLEGRTSIPGLFASGEVACTGLHGANRLASNSLLEALVLSRRAAAASVEEIKKVPSPPKSLPLWKRDGTPDDDGWVLISHDRTEIQRLMWDYVGIVRSNHRLVRARRRLKLIASEIEDFYKSAPVEEGIVELRNLALVAQLIIRSAALRKESRGLHYTTDYPERDDEKGKRDTVLRRSRISSIIR
ncbi:L-aspartate oxidase [candidate division LCP-89 bacterium B3_LCP]|uniref:L-aspartate oxidase n=1 Tax=candidate division LCP-89 bacterium B3_LCP TaxID=2012998 RepID=A0A532UTX7_UNCL8|nr:MAG: L-aspartate oxidase [candidate division LCP-89 bacterium B3_LCP]